MNTLRAAVHIRFIHEIRFYGISKYSVVAVPSPSPLDFRLPVVLTILAENQFVQNAVEDTGPGTKSVDIRKPGEADWKAGTYITTFATINGTTHPSTSYQRNASQHNVEQAKDLLRINVRTAAIKLIIRCFILAPPAPPAVIESSGPPPNPAPAAE